ncbi:MAG: polyprenyl synthetase family protein [Bacillota bacterium]|nr:polyprenyl synthetase family protein [Bacillota bacterium]
MNMLELKNQVDNWLNDYFKNRNSYNKIIYESMAYSLNIGGKRVRPLLSIYTYNMFKNEYEKVLPIACAIEMIHTYSLIHDDLPCMDNDDLRRGSPTNHKVYGDAIAVLAGDGLLTEAMNIMFNYCKQAGERALEACSIITNSSGAEGMVGGQVVDIISEGKLIPLEQLEYMHSKKTGELIRASIIAGAILGDASNSEIELLGEYGSKLGLAFQIKDDILDILGDTEVLGKPAKSDEENNKTNFITLHGIDKCVELCNDLTKECLYILKSLYRDTSHLEEFTKFLLNRKF